MLRGKIFSRSRRNADRRFEAAQAELDAVRVLVLDLHHGARLACIHLVRAATLLHEIAAQGGAVPADGGSGKTILGSLPVWSGWRTGRQRELESHFATVQRCAGSLIAGEGMEDREVEPSVRILHDLLEKALVALARGKTSERGRKLVAWAGWLAAGIAVAIVAVVVGLAGRASRGTPSARRAAARRMAVPRHLIDVALEDLSIPKPAGTQWDAPGNLRIPLAAGGVVVRVRRPSNARKVEISLDNNDTYRLDFLEGSTVVGRLFLGPTSGRTGLVVYDREIPGPASHRGFDAIRVVPVSGDGCYSIGHLLLDPPESPRGKNGH